MKIKSVNMTSYGKFSDKEIEFGSGINIIYGDNEAGKSTLMSFIKAMLYGFSGKGTNPAANERKKYLPWGGGSLAGEMSIETSDGEIIKLARNSGRTQASDTLAAVNMSTGEKSEFSADELIGIGEEAFIKTLFIKQLSSDACGEDDEIAKKLINLTHSGDEEIGYYKAEQSLREAMKKYKLFRGIGGKIDELKEKIAQINAELANAEKTRVETFEMVSRQSELNEIIGAMRQRLAQLDREKETAKHQLKYKDFLQASEIVEKLAAEGDLVRKTAAAAAENEKKYKVFEKDAEDIIYSPLRDETSKDAEKFRENAKKSKKLAVIFAAAAVCAGAAAVLVTPLIAAAAAVMCILSGWFFVMSSRSNKSVVECEKQAAAAAKANEEIRAELARFGVKSLKEYTDGKAAYNQLCERVKHESEKLAEYEENLAAAMEELGRLENTIGEIPDMSTVFSAEEIAAEEITLRNDIEKYVAECSEIAGFLSVDHGKTPDLILAERAETIEELDEAIETHEALSLARDTLEEVFAEMSSDFTPAISGRASEILQRITLDKHRGFTLDKKYDITMDMGGLKPLGYFSGGTVDQVYFSLRLAVADMLFGDDKPPLFLDDTFVQYDSQRLQGAIEELVRRGSEGQQIFFFSCRQLPDMGENVRIITLT